MIDYPYIRIAETQYSLASTYIILAIHAPGRHTMSYVVALTSIRRDVASISIRRHFDVMCPLGRVLLYILSWTLMSALFINTHDMNFVR